jgi:hypothetical protein
MSDSVTIQHGIEFKKKMQREKKKKHQVKKEGFRSNNDKDYLQKSENLLRESDIVRSKTYETQQLQSQFNSTLLMYNSAKSAYVSNTVEYAARKNSNLNNKNVRFSNGAIGYVTGEGIFKWYDNMETFNANSGKNGCPSDITDNAGTIDYTNPNSMSTSSPPVQNGTKMDAGQSCGSEGKNVYVSQLVNNPTSTYIGAYKDKSERAMEVLNGEYTYDTCRQKSQEMGKKYFALQGKTYDFSSGRFTPNETVECSVSNDITKSTQYGTPNVGWGGWNGRSITNNYENTSSGSDGYTYAGPGMNAIYTTSSTSPVYVGAYGDGPNRRMNWAGVTSLEQCKNIAKSRGHSYLGWQWGNWWTSTAQCFTSNDWAYTTSYGPRSSITRNRKNEIMGGGWTNAVYTVPDQTSGPAFQGVYYDSINRALPYYLGNVSDVATCNANASQRGFAYFGVQNGRQGNSECWAGNSLQNAIKYGEGLPIDNTSPDGKVYGGAWTNAIYENNEVGFESNLGKVGYVNEDSVLSEYPAYMIDRSNPNNPTVTNDSTCSKDIENIDSIKWEKYKKNPIQMTTVTKCGIGNLSESRIRQLESQLRQYANQIIENINLLQSLNVDIVHQMGIDEEVLKQYAQDYTHIIHKISEDDKNQGYISTVVSDSNLVARHENSVYILWIILAIITLILSIYILRK